MSSERPGQRSGPKDRPRSQQAQRRPGTAQATRTQRGGENARQGRPPARGRKPAQRNQRTVLVAAGGVVVLIVVIAIVLVATRSGSSPSAVATATASLSSATAQPASKVPTAPLAASAPSDTETAASKAACKPFLAAAQGASGTRSWSKAPAQVITTSKKYTLKLYTDSGVITAQVLPAIAPVTANNFVFLACEGFYDNTIFHRTIPQFMIQGGDPTGTGTGGPGYSFNDEKVARAYQVGDLAMANSGPNTNGSQFFIIQGSQGISLPPSYNLFGHVIAGQNVVDAIANAPTHANSGGEDSAPNTPVHIRTITLQVS